MHLLMKQAFDLGYRRWNAEALGRRLVAQGITVRRSDGAATVCGRSYPKGYLAVPQAQPAARLVVGAVAGIGRHR